MSMIRVYPAPSCPTCGAVMRLRRTKTGDSWSAFWGCNDWPTCDGTRRPTTKAEAQENMWPEEGVRYERI